MTISKAALRPALAAIVLGWGLIAGGIAHAGTVTPLTATSTAGTLTASGDFFGYIAGSVGNNGCGNGTGDTICSPAAEDTILSDAPFSLDQSDPLTATVFQYLVNVPPPAGVLTTGSSPENELATLKAITGLPLADLTTGIQTDPPTDTFSVSSLYFMLKIGNNWAFFRNDSGGTLELTWDGNPSFGLSHYTQFVPGPIVGAGIPGLVLACGGLIALTRRRRKVAL